ncbi:hypothetical protein AWENTII_002526 [Aspergillus wentii]
MVANSAVEEQEPEAPIEQAVENELVDQTPNVCASSDDSNLSNPPAHHERSPSISRRGVKFMKRLLRRMSSSSKENCVSCLDKIPTKDLINLPCRHKYCTPCFNRMVLISIADEGLFPPKCCSQDVPSKKVLSVLAPETKAIYSSKLDEYETPVADRWYCPEANCGKWIPPKALESESPSQVCPHCSAIICSSCRNIAHSNEECSEDPGLAIFLEEARLQKWQRCYNCGAMVELTFGCHQITCRCKAQFCYKCGSPWESCTCVVSGERQNDFLQLAVGGGGNLDRNQETELAAVVMAIEYAEREENEERQRREQLQGNEQRSQEQEGIDPRESHRRLEIDERARILGEFLSEINRLQQERLIHRQREEVYVFLSQQKAEGERLDRERRQVMEKHQWSIETRFQRLVAAQKADIQNMELEHKEEEDSLIVRFPRLYRGLPTAEAEYRESAVLAKLRGMQREEKLRLIEDHQQALADNKKETSIERGALESALKMQWRTEQKLVKAALRSLVQTCVYDRFWFDQVVAKREDLLEKYRQDLINSGNGLEDLSFVETRGGEFYPVMQEWI